MFPEKFGEICHIVYIYQVKFNYENKYYAECGVNLRHILIAIVKYIDYL